jgi:hypothetical protein
MNEAGELLLAERGLHVAIVAAGTECEARDLHPRFAKSDCVGGFAGRSVQRKSAETAYSSNGNRGFEELATGKWTHDDLLGWAGRLWGTAAGEIVSRGPALKKGSRLTQHRQYTY